MSLEKTQCPKCGKSFRFATEHLGSKTRCKNCEAIFVIQRPATPAQAKPVAAKPVAAKPVAAQPVQAKPVPAKPVQAKPVQAKPVQAKPVAAKPVQATPVQAKPVQATPIAAKPVQAKPVQAKPVQAKPVAAKPVAQPAPAKAASVAAKKETPSPPANEASPYEAFADEMLTGSTVAAAQRLSSVNNSADAANYLATNKKLGFSRKKRKSSDWATVFIFRGVNLAVFALILYGIAMLGMFLITSPIGIVTSPIAALLAAGIGLVGSVMVVSGFAAKPGSAAICGVIPALMFVAGGLLVGKLYLFDNHWDHSSNTMAAAKEHHQKIADGEVKFDPIQNQANRNNPMRNNPIRIQPPVDVDPFAEMRNRNNVPAVDPVNRDIDDQIQEARNRQKQLVEEAKRRRDEIQRKQREAAMQANQQQQANTPPRKKIVNGDDFDPFGGGKRVEPAADPGAARITEDRGDDEIVASPFDNNSDATHQSNISRMEYERNTRSQFGVRSSTQFPAQNLTKMLGKQKFGSRIGHAMIGANNEALVGFHAVASMTDADSCRNLLPIFDRDDSGSSVAKSGYAIGGIEATFSMNKLVAIRAIYMKIDGQSLDTGDLYFGEWFGDANAAEHAEQITTNGKIPIGIRVQGGFAVETIALIVK
ncbi:MAG: hypothetical protein AAFN77_00755 [Planctomycetota bacterium]